MKKYFKIGTALAFALLLNLSPTIMPNVNALESTENNEIVEEKVINENYYINEVNNYNSTAEIEEPLEVESDPTSETSNVEDNYLLTSQLPRAPTLRASNNEVITVNVSIYVNDELVDTDVVTADDIAELEFGTFPLDYLYGSLNYGTFKSASLLVNGSAGTLFTYDAPDSLFISGPGFTDFQASDDIQLSIYYEDDSIQTETIYGTIEAKVSYANGSPVEGYELTFTGRKGASTETITLVSDANGNIYGDQFDISYNWVDSLYNFPVEFDEDNYYYLSDIVIPNPVIERKIEGIINFYVGGEKVSEWNLYDDDLANTYERILNGELRVTGNRPNQYYITGANLSLDGVAATNVNIPNSTGTIIYFDAFDSDEGYLIANVYYELTEEQKNREYKIEVYQNFSINETFITDTGEVIGEGNFIIKGKELYYKYGELVTEEDIWGAVNNEYSLAPGYSLDMPNRLVLCNGDYYINGIGTIIGGYRNPILRSAADGLSLDLVDEGFKMVATDLKIYFNNIFIYPVYTVKVNYIDIDTGDLLEGTFKYKNNPGAEGNTILWDHDVIKAFVGSSEAHGVKYYDMSEHSYDGRWFRDYDDYTFVKAEGDSFTGEADSDKVINMYYQNQKANIYVHYIDSDGNLINTDANGNEVIQPEAVIGTIGDSYENLDSIKPIEIPGYVQTSRATSDLSGNYVFTKEDIHIYYSYRKIGNVVLRFVDSETNEEIVGVDRKPYSGFVGESYSDDLSKINYEIDHYNFVNVVDNNEGAIYTDDSFSNPIVVTAYYNKKYGKVIVEYVDLEGNSLADTIVEKGTYQDTYTSVAKDIDGYTLVSSPEQETVTFVEDEEIKLTYVYDLTKYYWDTDKSKTASDLNDDGETEITISLPSGEVKNTAEVVFVLDKSTYSDYPSTIENSLNLLNDLKESGASVKVAIVHFNRVGHPSEWFDVQTQYDEIVTALQVKYSGGSNIHAGLLAAQELLESDTEITNDNKFVVLISDGSTYLYCKDGDYTTPYTRTYAPFESGKSSSYGGYYVESYWNPYVKAGLDAGNVKRPKEPDADKWEEYLADVEARNNESNGNQYDYVWMYYDGTIDEIREGYIKTPSEPRTASNRDMAYWYANQVWKEFQSKYHTYAIGVKDNGAGDGNWDDAKAFMRYLNNNQEPSFDQLKKDLILLSKGSKVIDYVGNDFDFVNDKDRIVVKIGDQVLEAEEISENNYGFGKNEDGTYKYTVEYVPGEEEHLVWNINEDVNNYTHTQLIFFEKLINIVYEEGTHTVPTNEQGILYPINSEGIVGEPEEFEVPTVDYHIGKVIIHYEDLNNNSLRDNDELTGLVGTDYETESTKAIRHQGILDMGYKYWRSTGKTEGKFLDERPINVTYLYEKLGKLIVKYLDADDNSIVLADEVTKYGTVGDEYYTVDAEPTNYVLSSISGEPYGNYTEDSRDNPIVIIYYYTKPSTKVITHYVDVDDYSNELAEADIQTGKVGTEYTTIENNNIAYYDLVGNSGNITGKFGSEDIIVYYYYQRQKGSVTAYYIDDNTMRPIVEETTPGYVPDEYRTAPKDIEGYRYKGIVVGDETGNYIKDTDIPVYYFYERVGKVIINHLDRDTNEVLVEVDPKIGRIGYDYTTNEESINGYHYVGFDGNKNGTYQIDDQVVTYYYEKDKVVTYGDLKVYYIDTDNNQLAYFEDTKEVGTPYTTEDKEFDGYTRKLIIGDTTGIYKEETTVVTYVYAKNPETLYGEVIVKYIENTGRKLIDEDIVIPGEYGTSYTTEQKSFDGYDFVAVYGPTQGTIDQPKTTVIYMYEKIKSEDEGNTCGNSCCNNCCSCNSCNSGEDQGSNQPIINIEINIDNNNSQGDISITTGDNVNNNTNSSESNSEGGTATNGDNTTNVNVETGDTNVTTGDTNVENNSDNSSTNNNENTNNITTGDTNVENNSENNSNNESNTNVETGDTNVENNTNVETGDNNSSSNTGDVNNSTTVETGDNTNTNTADGGSNENTNNTEIKDNTINNNSESGDNNTNVTTGDNTNTNNNDNTCTDCNNPADDNNSEDSNDEIGTVATYYRTLDGEVLLPSDSFDRPVNSTYTTKEMPIEGYELIEVPENATGTVKNGLTKVVYVYKKKDASSDTSTEPVNGEVVAHYVDIYGRMIGYDKEYSGAVGDNYQTITRNFRGYELVQIVGDKEGQFKSDKQEVTYVYLKNADAQTCPTCEDTSTPETGKTDGVDSNIQYRVINKTTTNDYLKSNRIEIPNTSVTNNNDLSILFIIMLVINSIFILKYKFN